MTGALAVFDLGKTNSKLFVFSPEGALLDERRTKPVWVEHHGKRVLDDAHLFRWMNAELADALARHDIGGVTFSTHGCTFALVRGTSALLHPVLDYEQEVPPAIAAQIDPLLPDFTETFAPHLPLGLCYARHVFWLQQDEPEAFAAAEAILPYSQFWVWRFCGRAFSEYSYLGAHSQMWAPLKRDYSSLIHSQGWRDRMAPLAAAGAEVGRTTLTLADGSRRELAVHNGVHDSNAALSYYRMTGMTDFTLVSTGTWVIIINLDCPLDALESGRDMIANVTVDGEPAPSLRFMGGREYDNISDAWNQPISRQAVEAVIARGVYALPSWAAGGPFPELHGEIVGGEVSGEERAAVAALYVVMMSDLSLDLIRSTNTIVVDGGLSRMTLFTAMLAQLRPAQKVVRSTMSEGSATGAAALAFKSMGLAPFKDETVAVAPGQIAGLEAYRRAWQRLADDARAKALEDAA